MTPCPLPPASRALALGLVLAGAHALAAAGPVYRCPGPVPLYTDALTPKEAADRGCTVLADGPVSVITTSKPRAAAPAAGPAPAPLATPRASGEARIDAAQQRARDSDRRAVLEAELRDAEGRLAGLQAEYGGGNPERRGDERNYQKYLDRVAALKAGIERQQADIQAIKREIAKLPPQ